MFTPIKLPYTKYVPANTSTSYYVAAIHSAQPWIEEFNLTEICRNRDIRCVVGWIKPGYRMPIHVDMGDYGPTPWALDFTTEEFKDSVLELYENLDNETPSGFLGAPPANNYTIPILQKNKANLINEWPFTKGAVKFNPGKHWHTGFNPSKDKWMAVVSLRSFFIEDWYALEKHFSLMGML